MTVEVRKGSAIVAKKKPRIFTNKHEWKRVYHGVHPVNSWPVFPVTKSQCFVSVRLWPNFFRHRRTLTVHRQQLMWMTSWRSSSYLPIASSVFFCSLISTDHSYLQWLFCRCLCSYGDSTSFINMDSSWMTSSRGVRLGQPDDPGLSFRRNPFSRLIRLRHLSLNLASRGLLVDAA